MLGALPRRIALVVVPLALAVIGGLASTAYARAVAPGVVSVARAIASSRGWTVEWIRVASDVGGGNARLELSTRVPGGTSARGPWARAVTRVNAAGLAQSPVVFLAIVVLFPPRRPLEYAIRLALAPATIVAETALEQGMALLGGPSVAALELAGGTGVPGLQRWSQFTEAGGSLALAVAVALALVALCQRVARARK
jgi:hypothetical protein